VARRASYSRASRLVTCGTPGWIRTRDPRIRSPLFGRCGRLHERPGRGTGFASVKRHQTLHDSVAAALSVSSNSVLSRCWSPSCSCSSVLGMGAVPGRQVLKAIAATWLDGRGCFLRSAAAAWNGRFMVHQIVQTACHRNESSSLRCAWSHRRSSCVDTTKILEWLLLHAPNLR
jgi:hypothetical protein